MEADSSGVLWAGSESVPASVSGPEICTGMFYGVESGVCGFTRLTVRDSASGLQVGVSDL